MVDASSIVTAAIQILMQVQQNMEAFEYAQKRSKVLEEVCAVCLVTLQATQNAQKRANALDLPTSPGVKYALQHLLDQIMVMQNLLQKMQSFSRIKWIAMGTAIRDDLNLCTLELRACNTECFQVMQSWISIINDEERKRQYMIPKSISVVLEVKDEAKPDHVPVAAVAEKATPAFADSKKEEIVFAAQDENEEEEEDEEDLPPDYSEIEQAPSPAVAASPPAAASEITDAAPSYLVSVPESGLDDSKSPPPSDVEDEKNIEQLKAEEEEEDQRMNVSESEKLVRFLALVYEFSELTNQVKAICAWKKDRDVFIFKNQVYGYLKTWMDFVLEPFQLKELRTARTPFRTAVRELFAAPNFQPELLQAVDDTAEGIQAIAQKKAAELKIQIKSAGVSDDPSLEQEVRDSVKAKVRSDVALRERRQKAKEERAAGKEKLAREKEERKQSKASGGRGKPKAVKPPRSDSSDAESGGARRGGRRGGGKAGRGSSSHSEQEASPEPRAAGARGGGGGGDSVERKPRRGGKKH
eukprot:TRINITY_DN3264_c0_g1_i1.p1 TRINITY_DN3264_c0_g1~~TRINITY_DN3264_c0_g1_i1.p1  ORF type:complete len:526 (-),score=175.76 TRINITY_DN3264_c0_g1_i1:61-1638(-)